MLCVLMCGHYAHETCILFGSPLIMRLLDQLLDNHVPDDIQRLFNFMIYEKRSNLDTKAELCDLLLKHLQRSVLGWGAAPVRRRYRADLTRA